MNPDSLWRYEVACKLAPLYAANPHVAAVILGGSTARGHADKYSDLEIGVFWYQPPTDDERRAVVEAADADLIRLYPYDVGECVWSDDFMIGRLDPETPKSGLLVEVVNHTVDFIACTVDAVIQEYDPNELKQNLVAVIDHGIPLAGDGIIADWKSQVSVYPRELAVAVINRHATINHFWRWEMWLARGDNRMMLSQAFNQVQYKIMRLLLALNRTYYYGFKWLDEMIAGFEVAPENFSSRFKRILRLEPAESAQTLSALVEDTYTLVEKQFPEVDVGWLRKVFRYQRPVLKNAPKWGKFD